MYGVYKKIFAHYRVLQAQLVSQERLKSRTMKMYVILIAFLDLEK